MDLNQINNIYEKEFKSPTLGKGFLSSASLQINNLLKKQIRGLVSKFSSTGMSKSGISGVAENEIYSGAGEQLSDAAQKASQMDYQAKMNALGNMQNIAQYEDQKPDFWDFLGSTVTQAGGIGLGSLMSKWLGGNPNKKPQTDYNSGSGQDFSDYV